MSAKSLQEACLGGDDPLLDDERKKPHNRANNSSSTSCTGSVRADNTNDDEDARAQIDLALNSDFDPSLFDYGWTDEPATAASTGAYGKRRNERGDAITAALSSNVSDRTSPDMGGYSMLVDSGTTGALNVNSSSGASNRSAPVATSKSGGSRKAFATAVSMSEASFSAGVSAASTSTASAVEARRLKHQQGFKSPSSLSNSCDPKDAAPANASVSFASALPYSSSAQQHPYFIQPSTTCPTTIAASLNAQGPAAAVADTFVNMNAANLLNPSLLPLAFNALAAGASLSATTPVYFWPTTQLQQEQSVAAALSTQQQGVVTTTTQASAPPHSQAPSQSSYTSAAPASTATEHASSATSKAAEQPSNTAASLPPFLLFDAPIELRANFMKSQLAHGIPPMEDSNSLHYKLVQNDFEAQPPGHLDSSAGSASGVTSAAYRDVRLIDGRHGNDGNKQMKNAREQRRTQKITDLIEQLRIKMERNGWKVGLKSKFHTLSSCAEYVKHLVQVNKEKEEALERAKNDLEAKRRKIEEDKSTQQDPSDPESTTSSLTVSSGSANTKPGGEKDLSGSTSDGNIKTRECARKKVRLSLHESSISSSGDDSGEPHQYPGMQNVSLDHMVSSVSDITDSNKGSSSEGNPSRRRNIRWSSAEGSRSTSGSVSSDAAVAHRIDNHIQGTSHSDVVIMGRKRKADEIASKNSFELDYEEVFLKSNVPQLLATTSGRIVAHNEFFLKATGLLEEEVERLTIFSLVKSSNLSNLFEIVAAALRSSSPQTEEEGSVLSGPDIKNRKSSDPGANGKWNYSAVTLPCTTFRPRPAAMTDKQLYITVTLMTDADPLKRCFHCVFTDCPGTSGALGTISPDLVSLLFTEQHQKKDTARLESSQANERVTKKRGIRALKTK